MFERLARKRQLQKRIGDEAWRRIELPQYLVAMKRREAQDFQYARAKRGQQGGIGFKVQER